MRYLYQNWTIEYWLEQYLVIDDNDDCILAFVNEEFGWVKYNGKKDCNNPIAFEVPETAIEMSEKEFAKRTFALAL